MLAVKYEELTLIHGNHMIEKTDFSELYTHTPHIHTLHTHIRSYTPIHTPNIHTHPKHIYILPHIRTTPHKHTYSYTQNTVFTHILHIHKYPTHIHISSTHIRSYMYILIHMQS